MMIEQTAQYGEFHDAGVSRFRLEKGILNITLDCYNDDKNDYDPVIFVFHNVRDSKIDGSDTSAFKEVYEDGEVLDFNISGKTAKILIQWNDFKNKTNSTKSYSFAFEKVEVADSRISKH